MHCEAMAEGAASDALVDPRPASGVFDGLLQTAFAQMMTANDTRAWICGQLGGRKDVLPNPFPVGVRVLAFQSERQVNATGRTNELSCGARIGTA